MNSVLFWKKFYSSRFYQQWLFPICLMMFTLIGLIGALLADGIWDILSWLALALLVAFGFYVSVKPRVKTNDTHDVSKSNLK